MGNGDRAKTEAGDAVRAEHLQRSETLAKQAEQLAKQAEAAERSAKLKRDEAEHSRRTAEAMNGSVEAAKIDQETRQMKAEAAENAAIRKADENVREAENREKTRRADELSGFADRILAADGVSGNRLTAMGLGSGVSANGGVASDVKKLVDLLKQEVEQSKKIAARPSDGGITAVLGE